MPFFTTPKSTFVLVVKVPPGGGVELHTTQFRSSICIRPWPVRSVELLYQAASLVSDWIASCAPCRSFPIRFGIVHESAEDGDASPRPALANTALAPTTAAHLLSAATPFTRIARVYDRSSNRAADCRKGLLRLQGACRCGVPPRGRVRPRPGQGPRVWCGQVGRQVGTWAGHRLGQATSLRHRLERQARADGIETLRLPNLGVSIPKILVPKNLVLLDWIEAADPRLFPSFSAGAAIHRRRNYANHRRLYPVRARHAVSSQPVPPVPHSSLYEPIDFAAADLLFEPCASSRRGRCVNTCYIDRPTQVG